MHPDFMDIVGAFAAIAAIVFVVIPLMMWIVAA
jgi:hypothetical protein